MPKDLSMTHVLGLTTSYYGHILVAVPVRIKYVDRRHPKVHYITITFLTRKFDASTGLVYEYPYHTVKAWVGDNDTIHLMTPLPCEDEDNLRLAELFSVTPQQEEEDELNRRKILGELDMDIDHNLEKDINVN